MMVMNKNTKGQEQKPSEEQEDVPEETVELLNAYKHHFTLVRDSHHARAERIVMLQSRKSTKKLSEKKQARMQRRYIEAVKAGIETEQMLDQIDVRLSQIGTHVPFIPVGL